jgi:hypothetical protein
MMSKKILPLMVVSLFLLGTNGCPLSPAPVSQTGQTTSYVKGDDGDLQKGVTWPNPRFTDNLDGTVTDNLTGLIWLKDANCIATTYPEFDNDEIVGSGELPWESTPGDGRVVWQRALDFVAGINDGTYPNCGAGATDWRLPNRFELESLLTLEYSWLAVPDTAGTGQWSGGDPFNFNHLRFFSYWSSTTYAGYPYQAWCVHIDDGYVGGSNKSDYYYYVWPVRGG